MRTSALSGAKAYNFLKFMMCLHRQERWASADIFRKRREGRVNFAILADVYIILGSNLGSVLLSNLRFWASRYFTLCFA